ncbi:hypothetical protein B4135_3615 [Caldibacillus debilis]|uniref:Uncharacterized protein n=1 Tax=Caldibacillus debilis TaxID=301148 RepID=A0A150LDU0_9BACI|nr:hypothetical protein B4135_3615 [Caldibacillus debilis]
MTKKFSRHRKDENPFFSKILSSPLRKPVNQIRDPAKLMFALEN